MVVTNSSMSRISGGVCMNLFFGILEPPKHGDDRVLSVKVLFILQMLFQDISISLNCMVFITRSFLKDQHG